jgi:hypothetical protein
VNLAATGFADGADEQSLAGGMIDMHGPKAARRSAGAMPFEDERPEAWGLSIHPKFNSRTTKMYISLTNSGFNKWSKGRRPSNDNDDNTGGATPIAIREPSSDGKGQEVPRGPWSIPGVGGAF